jgi:uncharacterized protein (DUF433 family)
MELESYLDVIDADTIRVRGHRVDIAHVLAYYHEGYSAEVITLELPSLSLEEVYGVLTYYLHNRTDVDAYLARRAALAEQLMAAADQEPPSPGVQKVRALRARLARGQAA